MTIEIAYKTSDIISDFVQLSHKNTHQTEMAPQPKPAQKDQAAKPAAAEGSAPKEAKKGGKKVAAKK